MSMRSGHPAVADYSRNYHPFTGVGRIACTGPRLRCVTGALLGRMDVEWVHSEQAPHA
jgi:hypothetical protein